MGKIYSKASEKLIKSKNKYLVEYLLAGYPSCDNLFEIMSICEDSVDIFEIGFPSKNPFADGPLIADAHRSVDYEVSTNVSYWEKIRKQTNKVIWIMAYYDDFILSGKYLNFAKLGLMDGIVIPDTDKKPRLALQKELEVYNIDVIGFANPLMDEKELLEVLDEFSMVYEQLYVGQTGSANTPEMHYEMLEVTKKHGKSLAFAGFGINSAEKIEKIWKEGFDGAIIGTEIIRKINESNDSLKALLDEVKAIGE